MQTPADLRARKARLRLTYQQIADRAAGVGYPYPAGRIKKVLTEHEVSAPVCAAVAEVFDTAETEHEPA